MLYAHSSWGLVYSSRPHCRTSGLRVKVAERKIGEDDPRQFSASRVCGLLDGGKHFLNLGGFHFFERFRFDLTNPLPRHRQALPHLLQRAGLIVADTEA